METYQADIFHIQSTLNNIINRITKIENFLSSPKDVYVPYYLDEGKKIDSDIPVL